MKMNNVGIDLLDLFGEGLRLEDRPARHLRRDRREDAEAALQAMKMKTVGRLIGAQGMFAPNGVEGVSAVENVNLVTTSYQRPRKPVDIGRITTEAMGSETGGHHAEFQRRPPCRDPLPRLGAGTGPSLSVGRSLP